MDGKNGKNGKDSIGGKNAENGENGSNGQNVINPDMSEFYHRVNQRLNQINTSQITTFPYDYLLRSKNRLKSSIMKSLKNKYYLNNLLNH